MLEQKASVIIQARLGSKRYPEKILKEIFEDQNSLDLIYLRLKKSNLVNKIIFAVPQSDEKLIHFLKKKSYPFTTGDEMDLMYRYKKAAKEFGIKNIVRVTSDCPLVDPNIVDLCISKLENFDYVSNNTPPDESDYANGSDVEVFSLDLLEKVSLKYTNLKDKEHVTFPMWDGRLKIKSLRISKKRCDKHIRITLDHIEDLNVIKKILEISKNPFINYDSIIKIYNDNQLSKINGKFHYADGWN